MLHHRSPAGVRRNGVRVRLPRLLLRRISTQLYLLTLVAAVLVPLLAFGAFLLTRYAATERARFERDASQIARQVALVLDGELAGLAALLKGLSVSSALERGDLVEFYVEARRLVDGRDELVVLRDLDTSQLLNTQLAFGISLPPARPLSPGERDAFEWWPNCSVWRISEPDLRRAKGRCRPPGRSGRRDRPRPSDHRADLPFPGRAAISRSAGLDRGRRRSERHVRYALRPA